MDHSALRRILLALTGTRAWPDLAELSEADWHTLAQLAALQRLEPLLHAQHAGNAAVPSEVRAGWKAAHRSAALVAMHTRRELTECCALLEAHGHAPIALKGSWLAYHAYPEPAQRPMRDIDLLVPAAGVLEAFALLLAAGYRIGSPLELPLADHVKFEKHLPVLIAPRGTVTELHHRLWEPDGRLDHATPPQDEAPLRARAVVGADGIRVLAPQDTLAHLIIHAVYSHRLDCGPLLLPDIDFLLRAAPIDWPAFWAQAEREGWRSGARLVLDLVVAYRTDAQIDFGPDRGPPTPALLLAAAPDLLMQDLDTRQSAGVAAAVLKEGPGGLWQRLRGRRGAHGERTVTRDMASAGGMLGWAGSRLRRSLSDLARADVRRQSRQLAALSKWLDQ